MNWKVRFKNEKFWLVFIPTLGLFISQILALFGVQMDFSTLVNQLIAIVKTIFGMLALLGIAVDFTTAGWGDTKRAMGYDEPYKDVDND